MNERIKQLYEQSLNRVNKTDHDGNPVMAIHQDPAKFAELIVAECCQVLSKETIRHDGYGYNQHALYQKIREHFGVEQ